MLEDLQVLSSEECKKVHKSLYSLRSFWIERGMGYGAPFYTLGAASYLDAVKDQESYYTLAQRGNIVLESYFKWLHSRLKEKLEEALGAPVLYHPGFALPGFHIFLASKVFEKPVASLHLDLQYTLLDWGKDSIDTQSPISFTLSIRLPSGGGGLFVWDVYKADMEGLSNEEVHERLQHCERNYHSYTEGQLVLHSGHMYHQIAPMRDSKPGDERITLQGHGIRCGDTYHVYW